MHYLSILTIASTLASCVVTLPHERRAASGLNAAAKGAAKLYFGTATDANRWGDAGFTSILDNVAEIGQLTPENSMKWLATEGEQNKFDYTGGDALVQRAQKNGQMVRCHTLVWHASVPNWVANGQWTRDTLIAAMKNHIANVAGHFKGKCYAWDVVNEAFNRDGTYRDSIFHKIIGPDFIPIAFAAAAAADPQAKLYYNDYSIEVDGPKSQAARKLVTSLKAQGIKIDGVGMQSHFSIGGATPSLASQKNNMQLLTALGVEVAITELDIAMTLPATQANLDMQRTNYRDTISACVQVKGCVGITVWGFSDKYSWISARPGGKGAACVWDTNLQKKPAYLGIIDGFGGPSQAYSPPTPYSSPAVPSSAAKAAATPPAQHNYNPSTTTKPLKKFTTVDLTTLSTRTSLHGAPKGYPTGSHTTPESNPTVTSDSGPDSAASTAATDSVLDSTATSNSGPDSTPTTDSVPDSTATPTSGPDSTTPAPYGQLPTPTDACAPASTVTVSTQITVTITGTGTAGADATPTQPRYAPNSLAGKAQKVKKKKKAKKPCSKGPKKTSTVAAGARPTGTYGNGGGQGGNGGSGVAKHYEQCGGEGWMGATKCEGSWTCQPQKGNKYYSQCL
ncbi:hypothetical protein MMC30_001306 [Trapelia coarctata]|nr:hypothetical protein [Trapelia coarctata]